MDTGHETWISKTDNVRPSLIDIIWITEYSLKLTE